MNSFELLTMMYAELEHEWEENFNKDEELGNFLTEVSPFTWDDYSSADPAIYIEFAAFCKGKSIGADYGYGIVRDYLKIMPEQVVYEPFKIAYEAFLNIPLYDFIEDTREYLAEPHKGDSLPEDLPFEVKPDGEEFAPLRVAALLNNEEESAVPEREPALV
jgi:hypothetical protein